MSLDYAQLKVVDYVQRIKPNLTGKEMSALTLVIREAMRDQRRGCADALLDLENLRGASEPPVIYRDVATHAVMDAEPKELDQ